jgi:prevent-host-death family protein
MTETSMSSREANQNFSRAKRAARDGPVIITERGKPAQVLVSYEEYRRLKGAERNILESLAMPGAEDIDLDLPARRVEPFREIEF